MRGKRALGGIPHHTARKEKNGSIVLPYFHLPIGNFHREKNKKKELGGKKREMKETPRRSPNPRACRKSSNSTGVTHPPI